MAARRSTGPRSDSWRRRTPVSDEYHPSEAGSNGAMGSLGRLFQFLLSTSNLWATRRRVLLTPLLAAVPLVMGGAAARAGRIDPSQTAITLPDAMKWVPW